MIHDQNGQQRTSSSSSCPIITKVEHYSNPNRSILNYTDVIIQVHLHTSVFLSSFFLYRRRIQHIGFTLFVIRDHHHQAHNSNRIHIVPYKIVITYYDRIVLSRSVIDSIYVQLGLSNNDIIQQKTHRSAFHHFITLHIYNIRQLLT
ncbi:hypothetical protein BJ165DRAFT_1446765 [Panaeolus papilionaceus]|nr:hypothetical protein BJ165DRAFT_1446765 [Panaeolus papilionaceus]